MAKEFNKSVNILTKSGKKKVCLQLFKICLQIAFS